ncbi:hypothetical protein [Halococcus hamelinensis]|uniref:hypothetical protein n=1 Tax=Halococcus hamelinensis TaxID=332168 RepID=UPI001ED93E61|nr:hypothetical protein [Halococcus hamelinensis]
MLIAVLCLGVLLVFLDVLGISVIKNLRDDGIGDLWYLLYPVAMALLSYLVERFRDVFDQPHSADVPDPLGDREHEDEEAEDEPATEQRTVEFARSRNESTE